MASPPSEAARPQRPLSPHLGVYRWQWTMALSILHRITGIVLAAGTLLLIYWLWAAASGPAAYADARELVGGWFGRLCLFGWTLALFYHLFNGIRHLVWDAGRGFELRTAYFSGLAVVAATVAAAFLTWIIGYMVR
jgi:succinate dehydrogenase / fumarate reductase cytochrome b subunit